MLTDWMEAYDWVYLKPLSSENTKSLVMNINLQFPHHFIYQALSSTFAMHRQP